MTSSVCERCPLAESGNPAPRAVVTEHGVFELPSEEARSVWTMTRSEQHGRIQRRDHTAAKTRFVTFHQEEEEPGGVALTHHESLVKYDSSPQGRRREKQ